MRNFALFIVLIILSQSNVFSQFKTRIYNIHYERPFSQVVTYNEKDFSTTDMAFGGNVCVGNKFLNTIIEYNYHRMNIKHVSDRPKDYLNVHEILFGLRYYNARPTFLVGNVAFRLTAGWSGGFDFDLQTRSMYFVGFALTGIRQPSGILIQAFYHRTAKPTQGFQIKPYFGIRLGFVIGPSAS